MSGIFDFMRKMVEGKPVFEDPAVSGQQGRPVEVSQSQQQPDGPAIDKGNERSFPIVRVKHVNVKHSGDRMQVYLRLVNEWPEEVMLDKIRAFGTVHEIDDFLDGHKEDEFLVYDGPRLKQQYHEAQLDYKTQRENDYFQAIHDVKYTYHAEDGTYSVDEMRIRLPIRDIYG